MQKETVYFGIHFATPSPHSGYDITCHFVGMAECTGDHRHLSKIHVKRLYIAADPNINESPLAYNELEFDVEGFEDSPAGKEIIRDICERFGTDNENETAVQVCDYYRQRKEAEWKAAIVTTYEQA